MWGALPGGNRFNENATKIEAYRMGMEAVLEGAGTDSFILGCNAPMWPSLGLVHGMRVTGDISRSWPKIKMLAREGSLATGRITAYGLMILIALFLKMWIFN